MKRVEIHGMVTLLFVIVFGGCLARENAIPSEYRARIEQCTVDFKEGKLKWKQVDEMIAHFGGIQDRDLSKRCFFVWVRHLAAADISGLDYDAQGRKVDRLYSIVREICLAMNKLGYKSDNWFRLRFEILKWYRAQIVRLEKERNRKRTFAEDSQYRSCRHGWEVGYQVEINGLEEMLDTSVRKVASAEEFARLSAAFEKFLGRKLHSAAEAWRAQGNAVKLDGRKLPDVWFALYGTTNAPAAKKGDPK